MAETTKIEWTDSTWSIITGCSVKSPGCQHCYAMTLAGTRLRNHPSRAGLTREVNGRHVWTGEVRLNEQWLDQPLRWKKPRDIFVAAHGDLFHENVPGEWVEKVFSIMVQAQRHRFQVLTKRPGRAVAYLCGKSVSRLRCGHIWIGTSVERQQEADERRPYLESLAKAGWNTWISYEPALGPVDWAGWEFARWMVSGGESGPGARPSHPDWHRATRDWCAGNGIGYFFKQWGAWKNGSDFMPDAKAVLTDGRILEPTQDAMAKADRELSLAHLNPTMMRRIGKARAGHLLDGRAHREMPP